MSKGQFSLDIQWPTGKMCMDGQISDEQYSAICKILSPDNRKATDLADMVNRFLSWRLPDDFAPDAGISFTPSPHPHAWPIGTNLLSADQAKAMLIHVLSIDSGNANG